MALNEEKRGGIAGHVLPLPLDKASSNSNLEKNLGQTFEIGDGLVAILVQAGANQSSPGKLCFKWTDSDEHEVVITSATGNKAVGVAHPDLEDLTSGDYFLLMRPAHPGARVTCVDSGSGITAGDVVQPTSNGEVITDAAFEAGVSLGQALATAAADADVDVLLQDSMFGANA